MQRFFLLFLFIAATSVFSCAPKYAKHISGYQNPPAGTKPDYSNLFYWAAHPYKQDPSDSIPRPLQKTTMKDSTVDVFFLHPTTFTDRNDTAWNADLHDAALNAKTDYSPILYQASAFNEYRVFAPRYRQANVAAYYTVDTLQAKKAFDLAYADIRESFQYYLDHFNKGRPIVIAAHSQGSTHAQRLLKEFFENKTLKNRLVVAYILGMYIPGELFTSIPICRDANQTGCIVGWRTYKSGYEPDFVKKESKSGWVVNPLTWSNDTAYGKYKMNLGGVITNFNKLRLGITDGQIHDGVLWINRPHIPGSFLLRMKNFHVGDVNLFYVNIRKNLRHRVGLFWKG